MNIFKTRKNEPQSDYKLALEEAEGSLITTRPGDEHQDHKVGGQGVRIMVSDFGRYQQFILTNDSKDWLKKAYSMSDAETEKVFRTLMARARKTVREAQERHEGRGYIPGTRLKSLVDNLFMW